MASKSICDPCLEENKSNSALKYCSECHEKLCKECADSHLRFKSFKRHHLIDCKLADTRLPPTSSSYCETHPDYQLELFCKQHDAVCCCLCVPDAHSSCTDILSIQESSKDIKTSTLFSDSIKVFDDLTENIYKLTEDREKNRDLLDQTKQSIMDEIRDVKATLLTAIDDLEKKLILDLKTIYDKNKTKISTELETLSTMTGTLKEKKEQLEFLRDNVSEKQMFITLRQIIIDTKQSEFQLQSMIGDTNEVNMKFDRTETIQVESLGSIVEVIQPCNVKYMGTHSKVAQVQQVAYRKSTELKLEGVVELNSGITYKIRGIVVAAGNLFLCNSHFYYPKIYVYKDCKTYLKEMKCSSEPYDIAVIPQSNKAVISLPDGEAIQFVDIRTCELEYKKKVGINCFGVAASTDRIFVGGIGTVLILKYEESKTTILKTINILQHEDFIYNLSYNEQSSQLLLRCTNFIQCVTLGGEKVYRYDVSGYRGLAVDQNKNAYVSAYDTNEIQCISQNGVLKDTVSNQSIDRPTHLTFNADFTKLLVVTRDGQSISFTRVNNVHK